MHGWLVEAQGVKVEAKGVVEQGVVEQVGILEGVGVEEVGVGVEEG